MGGLMKKLLCVSATIVFIVVAALQADDMSKSDATTAASAKATEMGDTASWLVLTLEELAKYNGTDGKPAYVAIDGIIYDVSPIKPWKNGKHKGNTAGNDLTEVIKKKSPHGLKVLKKLKAVGKLAQKE